MRALRPFFHWKFSGVFIPAFFGGGIGMISLGQYFLAYIFFCFFGVWGVCYWLTSDVLQKKGLLPKGRMQRKDLTVLAKKQTAFFLWKWGGSIALVVLAAACLLFTNRQSVRHDLEVGEQAQKDVLTHLMIRAIQPSPKSGWATAFSITNGGATDIEVRSIDCDQNLIITMNGFVLSANQVAISGETRLLAGGDVETSGCPTRLFFVGTSPNAPRKPDEIKCADITVSISYELTTQPSVTRKHYWRYLGRQEGDNFTWYGQPISESRSPCLTDVPKGENLNFPPP
jgi:hypothetical protein